MCVALGFGADRTVQTVQTVGIEEPKLRGIDSDRHARHRRTGPRNASDKEVGLPPASRFALACCPNLHQSPS